MLCGTHVLCCTGRTHGNGIKTIEYLEGGADKLFENIRDNFYCPLALIIICRKLGLHYTYIGTGYLFAYDNNLHTINGKAFNENGKIKRIKLILLLFLKICQHFLVIHIQL